MDLDSLQLLLHPGYRQLCYVAYGAVVGAANTVVVKHLQRRGNHTRTPGWDGFNLDDIGVIVSATPSVSAGIHAANTAGNPLLGSWLTEGAADGLCAAAGYFAARGCLDRLIAAYSRRKKIEGRVSLAPAEESTADWAPDQTTFDEVVQYFKGLPSPEKKILYYRGQQYSSGDIVNELLNGTPVGRDIYEMYVDEKKDMESQQ